MKKLTHNIMPYISLLIFQFAYIDQMIHIIKSNSIEGLSINMYIMMLIGAILSLVKGIIDKNKFFTITYVLCVLSYIALIVLYFIYK